MRVFQEEIFGPVVSVTVFDTPQQALEIANDTLYGLGSGIWTRDLNLAYRFGRGIKAGRVWTNCYHAYPAHAAFGGYKKSGIGRETHKMMLDHYQQTKNVLVSYSTKALGILLGAIHGARCELADHGNARSVRCRQMYATWDVCRSGADAFAGAAANLPLVTSTRLVRSGADCVVFSEDR